MAIIETAEISPAPAPYVDWAPIIAGAVAASAISSLLLTFGGAIGLSLTSPWPGSGARLWVVAFFLLWWMVAVQIGSFAAGGYLAGRMRSRWGTTTTAESQFRDSVHGFMVWALGVLIGALVLGLIGLGAAKTAAQSASMVVGGAASTAPAAKAAPADYAVDLLLRPAPAAAGSETKPAAGNDDVLRGEANRIFTSAIANRELSQRDYDYLSQVVAARTGLPQADAQQRVQQAVAEARDLEIKTREAADKARKSGVLTGFIAAASLLISMVAAILAAAAGGRHRDENRIPTFSGHRFW
ncbi:MAG: hypothetical protein U1E61_14370 [Bradyrhizobium sp.]